MAARALSTVDVCSGLKDILACAEGSGFGLAFDPGVQREPDDLLFEGRAESATATGSGPNLR
ncbi:hypothetical protein [Tunturiibacter gelidiferens]|uniref:hypothetical protein n=1 Tax=Tunturiibacter gelidiferens TaxID=3069689 RepID=UPI003D9B865E